jgi:centromere/kinetochore protein ZW10
MWLRDKLAEFQSEWQKRNDLSPRAYGKVRLETEIKNLESFGKRAYANELNAQRTVITDLLGGEYSCSIVYYCFSSKLGAQNFFREDATFKTFEGELDAEIESVMKHIRTVAAAWKPILAYSAWASAIGSLVNTVASKIISDVFDLEDVSADGANSIAASISDIIKINDLFIPPPDPNAQSNGTDEEHTDPTPTTWQFADKWVKLQFLGEVLKEDLHGIKYYWFEGGLSLHFTAEEVVELIGLSFENNPASRQAKKQIKENPSPRVE